MSDEQKEKYRQAYYARMEALGRPVSSYGYGLTSTKKYRIETEVCHSCQRLYLTKLYCLFCS